MNKFIDGNDFRIRKMNAIEALALRTASNLKDVEGATKFFNEVLERIEIKVGEQWLPVKQKGRDVFLPDGIENDADAIQTLVEYFMKSFMQPFFSNSGESND